MADPRLTAAVTTECIPNATAKENIEEDNVLDDEEDTELLQHLATRNYYSYTAALGVTVGVGCLLLVLNMLIFAGIYYQRDRDRKRQNNRSSRSNSTPSSENIPLSQRPTPCASLRASPALARKDKYEYPPCYSTLPKTATTNEIMTNSMKPQCNKKGDKPPPPVRTSSNPPGGTIKKRVQIQEISV